MSTVLVLVSSTLSNVQRYSPSSCPVTVNRVHTHVICITLTELKYRVLHGSTNTSVTMGPEIRGGRSHEALRQLHHATNASRVPAAGSGAELALDEELHDGHGGAIDRVLLVSGRRAAAPVEELGCLGHGEGDQLRLGAAAATAATGCELLERLKRSGAAQRSSIKVARIAPLICLVMGLGDTLFVDGLVFLLRVVVQESQGRLEEVRTSSGSVLFCGANSLVVVDLWTVLTALVRVRRRVILLSSGLGDILLGGFVGFVALLCEVEESVHIDVR